MQPLIDCDVLRYEIGACGQTKDEDGNLVVRDFDFVANLFDEKIAEICELTWADEEPILFLTVDARTKRIMNRPLRKQLEKLKKECPEETEAIRLLEEEMEYKPNFREAIAKTKPYKATRKHDKPVHYDNLTAYILGNYETRIASGLEADDLLSIYQTERRNGGGVESIICTRDKDLRMVPGWHFGWACGNQPAFGPTDVTPIGGLEPVYKNSRLDKLRGTGYSFFCSQLITGDAVDNIPGLPRKGPVAALELLDGLETQEDMLKAVRDAYKAVHGDDWDKHMLEQARLLWMVRELDDDGQPVMFELPEYLYETH